MWPDDGRQCVISRREEIRQEPRLRSANKLTELSGCPLRSASIGSADPANKQTNRRTDWLSAVGVQVKLAHTNGRVNGDVDGDGQVAAEFQVSSALLGSLPLRLHLAGEPTSRWRIDRPTCHEDEVVT